MSPNKTIATICYALLALVMAGVGGHFLNLSKFASVSQLALGMNWESLAPSVQEMLTCMVGTRGVGLLVTGFMMTAILIGPFRHGRPWTRWALPLLSLTGLSLSIEVISGLELMHGNLALLAPAIPTAGIALAGCLFSCLDRPFKDTRGVVPALVVTTAYKRS